MDAKLYVLMDWAAVEELVYSESSNPHEFLGPHLMKEGLVIQAFIPTASSITVRLSESGKEYPMDLEDEAGYFAVLIPRKTCLLYTSRCV